MIVRNPLDCIYSNLQFTHTVDHSAVIANKIEEEFPDFWDKYIKERSYVNY